MGYCKVIFHKKRKQKEKKYHRVAESIEHFYGHSEIEIQGSYAFVRLQIKSTFKKEFIIDSYDEFAKEVNK